MAGGEEEGAGTGRLAVCVCVTRDTFVVFLPYVIVIVDGWC